MGGAFFLATLKDNCIIQKNKKDMQHTENGKMADVNTTLSVITINVTRNANQINYPGCFTYRKLQSKIN